MGLLSTLKSVLGFGGSSGRSDGETTVTVEREAEAERAEPDATSERAVKEAEPDGERDGSREHAEREDVQEIKGIGPTYAERLGEAGVETVADLAGGDADELADETGIAATRIEGWIERARAR